MTGARRFFEQHRSVLLLMLLLSLAAHAGAFWLVAIVDRPNVGGWVERPRVHVMQPSLEAGPGRQMLYRIADLLDPSLVSAPSARGFSNRMWSKTVPLGLQAQNWQVGPAYLAPPAAPAVTNLLPQPPLTERLQAAVPLELTPPSEPTEHPIPAAAVLNRSVFQLRGGLEKRAVVKAPALPSLVHLGGLRPTNIRAAVGADGLVKYATLERGSGSEEADAAALTAVRQIQFVPAGVGGEGLEWGMVRFYWATTAAPEKTP